MKTLQVKSSDSLEKKVIASILRRRDMPLTSFSDKLNAVLGEQASFFTTRSRVERAVSFSRLSDLFALVGYSLMVVPADAAITVSTASSKPVRKIASNRQALLFMTSQDEAAIETHTLEVTPHWEKRK